MRKSILLVSLGVLSIAAAVQARPRHAKKAGQVAAEFYQSRNRLPIRPVSIAEPKLVYKGSVGMSRQSAEEEASYYVFNIGEGGGFVIVSGDDRVAPVIGYSTTASFDPGNMPDNMRGWLSECERIIAYAQTLPENPYPVAKIRAAAEDSVRPMVTTQWGQGNPYNMRCPRIGRENALTGCVATAMAQIMKYHKWPERAPEGTGGYLVSGKPKTINDMSEEFETFDWDKMRDSYKKFGSDPQKEAVANLMAACGAGVWMQYESGASGAYVSDVATSLVQNMGYDENVSYVLRDAFPNDEWLNLIKSELREGRPVLYAGSSNAMGAHAFVCDGYDGNGLFHINWGWDGMDDGYFNLDLLAPATVGYAGFSYSQEAIVGIQKPAKESVPRGNEGLVVRSFTPENDEFKQGGPLKFRVSVQNESLTSINFQLGFELRDEAGKAAETVALDSIFKLDPYYYYPRIQFTKENFSIKPGTYKLQFIYKETGETKWKDIPFKGYETLSGKNVSLVATESELKWVYDTFDGVTGEMTGYILSSGKQLVGAVYKIHNSGNAEFHPSISVKIQSEEGGRTMDFSDLAQIYLSPKGETSCNVVWDTPLSPGSYTVTLYAEDGDNPSLSFEIAKDVIDGSEGWEAPTANESVAAPGFSIRVHPDRIAVQSETPVLRIELFDIAGRRAASAQADELPTGDLPRGVYIVRVTTGSGVKTEKVILHP